MPTRRGRVLLFAAPVLYILGRLTTVGELHALALAAIVFPLLSIAFVRWSRHRIGFTRVFCPERIFAGKSVRIEITARNLGRLPTPPLFLEDGGWHAMR